MPHTNTILIVDDNQANLFTIEELLAPEGYNLVLVTNGPEALEAARTIEPDLIILDVMMPGMDGFTVCSRLRQTPLLAEVPILMLTILSEREYFLRGLQVGADDFITKPFDPLELRARIKSILRLNRYRRLVNERRRFRWVVDQSENGYLLLNQAHEITYANAQGRLLLGLPDDPTQWNERTFLDWARPHYQPQPTESWDKWPHLPQHEPLFLIRPQSTETAALWLEVTILEDLANPHETDYLLRLRHANEHVTSFYSQWTLQRAISHKMRTPLIAMFSGLDLLRHNAAHFTPEEVAELAGMGYDSAVQMKQQVDDIVRYIELPHQPLAEGQLLCLADLPELVRDTAVLQNHPTTQLRVQMETTGGERFLRLSEAAGKLILQELFENATRFHPEQTPYVEVTITADAQHTSLIFADNGRHIPVEQLTHIWRPYYQAEKQFTGQVAGLGLGLSLVSILVWQLGGSCHLTNRLDGPGVRVELTIPFFQEGSLVEQQANWMPSWRVPTNDSTSS
jgi:two-component system, cell cycle response regulator